MTNRRSIFAVLGATLVAAAAFWSKRTPEFVERTPPGNRYRTFPLGETQLYIREDLLRSGWYRDLRFHERKEDSR